MKDFSSFLAENDYLVQEYMAKDLISEENPLDLKSQWSGSPPCKVINQYFYNKLGCTR